MVVKAGGLQIQYTHYFSKWANIDRTRRYETLLGSLRTKQMYNSLEIGEEIHKMAFSPDGKFIALAGGNNIKIVDAWSPDNSILKTHMKGIIQSILFHPTLPILIAASGDRFTFIKYNEMKITDYETSHKSHHISISPDGRLLAVADFDGNMIVYEFENLERSTTIYYNLKHDLNFIQFNAWYRRIGWLWGVDQGSEFHFSK